MDPITLVLVLALSALSTILYIFIGILPGTDETATMAPIALTLLLAGVDPLLVLAWFMASIAAFKMADSIPVALAGIPGGVMAVPQVPDALVAKERGLADTILRKGIAASVVGQVVALAVTLSLSYYIMPAGEWLRTADVVLGVRVARWFWLVLAGLIVLALTSRSKFVALVSIPSLALLIQGLRSVYGKPIFISLFLGITIGPMIFELLSMLHRDLRQAFTRRGMKEVKLVKIGRISLNPVKILSKDELAHSTLWSAVTSVLATVMSPVGLTILIGDLLREGSRDRTRGAVLAYTVRDAIKNATYVGGTLVPLLVIGVPTGPMSAGPAGPFFQKLESLGMTPRDYIVKNYDYVTIAAALLLATGISFLIAYPILVKYSRKITLAVFRRIPAEALYGLFIAIVLMLSYYDARVPGIFGTLVVSLISGALWKLGVSLGVLFMTLVAAPTLVSLLSALPL
ncbi:MAG: tripartite tricarboxylate transporter permease [Sulfolobales archaeon]|nr:tripartite tricarboxylate transporter permease [Sulfolobales archaeon]MDW8009975.1 tripartite tricarboxylate transporter permease [Sulfolobales archaeon]